MPAFLSGWTLGQALLKEGNGNRVTLAKGNQFFENGEIIRGDFDPDEHQPVRRWGQAGNTRLTKGYMTGSEIKPGVDEVIRWLSEEHPEYKVDPETVNAESIEDLFLVKALNGDVPVFDELFHWRERVNPPSGQPGQPEPTNTEKRLGDLEERMSVVENQIAALNKK